MTCRIALLTEQDMPKKIVENKDSQNTKKSTKLAKKLFADYRLNYVPLICIFLTCLEINYQFYSLL